MSAFHGIPHTPLVHSPSPAASDSTPSRDSYFGPITRSISRRGTGRVTPAELAGPSDSDDERSRQRAERTRRKLMNGGAGPNVAKASTANGDVNGHLAPPESPTQRSLSRSPSPLGLIPIHTRFRSFIHRHEIPRKALHVSIGVVTLTLYARGYQTSAIHPILLTALVPITTVDILRHNIPSLNKLYIRVCGALMRESEVSSYNGVIWYLAGAWAVVRFCPKDVGVMGVLLLSWCDTAASTVGRAWGRRTWSLRRGKSAAGSAAAMLVGALTAWAFWGLAVSTWGVPNGYDVGENSFAFQGVLTLPSVARQMLGLSEDQASIKGNLALGVLSLWTAAVASASEAVDLFGMDDNFTIPVLCGIGLWGFLKVFGHG